MAVHVQVMAGPDGPEVCSRADGAEATTLEALGRRLVEAAHPGVVPVRSSGPRHDGWELRVEHGGPSLDALRPLPIEQAIDVAARVAGTLADLHGRGIVHGQLTAARILVGRAGPVLDGFAVDVPASVEDDVAAFGVVLRQLADDGATTGRRSWLLPPRVPGVGAALATLAADATDPRPERRPTAPRLAAALAAMQPSAPTVGTPRGPLLGALAVIVVAAVVVLGGAALRPEPPPTGAATTAWTRSTTTLAPAGSTSTTIAPRCVAQRGTPVVASAQCPQALAVEGTAVVVDGTTYALARAGDDLAVGDFDCDGAPTAALLRPATGEVLELGPLLAGAEPAVVHAARVDGARGFAIGGTRAGCPTLAVVTSAGEVVAI